jgi:hypothetical protein
MHMVWALMAMKLVSGLPGSGQAHVDPKDGAGYVEVAMLPHYTKVQVAVYTDLYTCQVWALRIASLSDVRVGSAECLAQSVN